MTVSSVRRSSLRLLLVAAALATLTACPSTTVDSVLGVEIVLPSSTTLVVGNTVTLRATVKVTGNAAKEVIWTSSDPVVASIDEATGTVTALNPGSTEVTATSKSNLTKHATITLHVVMYDSVVSVTIDEPLGTLFRPGDAGVLTASVEVTGNAADTVTWASTQPEVVSIDEETGEFATHDVGSAEITATSTFDPTHNASITLTVTEEDGVSSVQIDEPASATIDVGDVITLTAVVRTTGSAPDTVRWSSSQTAVAGIDEDTGELTALSLGVTVITATSTFAPTMSDSVTITVSGVQEVSIDSPASTTVDVGEDITLTATVTVTGSASQVVSWTSSAPGVATIDPASGQLTGIAPGTATVTAASVENPALTDSVTMTVRGVTAVEIVPPPSTVIDVSGTVTLSATVTAFGGASTAVTWASSDALVASVNPGTGTVTGLAAGTTTITATTTGTPSRQASIGITVRGVLGVSIDPPASTSIEVGNQAVFVAQVAVVGGAASSVVWTTTDPTVATVSGAGVLTANRPGSTEVVATSTADPSKSDHLLLTVTPWQKQIGTAEADRATAVAVDSAGSSYVVGWTEGGILGQDSEDLADAFVMKVLPGGSVDWVRQFGTNRNDMAYAVAVDGAGNVLVAGQSAGGLVPEANVGHFNAFLRKYSSSGVHLWTHQFSANVDTTAFGVAADSDGNIVVVGRTAGDLQGTNLGGNDAFARMYSSDGTIKWTQQFGSASDDEAVSVALLPDTVFIAGITDGSLPGHVNAGNTDVFVLRLDASTGNTVWTTQFGTVNGDYNHGVVVASDGKVVIAGNTYGPLEAGAPGSGDAYVAKYEPTDGSLIWRRQFGTSATDVGYGLATAANGDIFVVGSTQGSLGGPNAGGADVYARRFDPAGTVVDTVQFGSSENETPTGVGADQYGNVIVVGYTAGGLAGANLGGDDVFIAKYGL